MIEQVYVTVWQLITLKSLISRHSIKKKSDKACLTLMARIVFYCLSWSVLDEMDVSIHGLWYG